MASAELKLDALGEWARIESRITGRPAPPGAPRAARETVATLAVAVVRFAALALLPFFVLVRVAVFGYVHERYPAWAALAAGAACTFGLVTGYAAWAWRRLTGERRVRLMARRVALPLVVAYCGYALLYLSSANTKSERVRAYYTSLHPLLRLAVSTWILVDRDLLITDLARRPEDYAAMGLPVYDGSLHYRQPDGYAHAADLRTTGRSEVKNRLVRLYFVAMGFDTLRHGGTADHLHVELPVK